MSRVELYEEPIAVMESLSENKAEMSKLQSAMLCGLIENTTPSYAGTNSVSRGVIGCHKGLLRNQIMEDWRRCNYYDEKTG